MLLSVIMSVRNKNKDNLINKALDSFNDMICVDKEVEIIVIDDNSTDGTKEVISDFVESEGKDYKIKFFSLTETKSTGYCRNIGIEASTGEYICFLDGDDYMKLGAILGVVEKVELEGADIGVGYYLKYSLSSGEIDTKKRGIHINHSYLTELPTMGSSDISYLISSTNSACWNKVFRSSFLKENGIKFPNSVFGEDMAFTDVCLMLSKKTIYVDELVYLYTAPDTNSTSTDNAEKVMTIWKDLLIDFDYILGVARGLKENLPTEKYKQLLGIIELEILGNANYSRKRFTRQIPEFDIEFMNLLCNVMEEIESL